VSDSWRDEPPTSDFTAGREREAHPDEPVTGPPAGTFDSPGPVQPAGTAEATGTAEAASTAGPAPTSGPDPAAGPAAGPAPASGPDPTAGPAPTTEPARGRTRRRLASYGPAPAGPGDERQRRRRRWFVAGISVAAAVVILAICAGALSIVSAINDARDRAAEARDARAVRVTDCLDLERRLNRLIPPGSSTAPAARATAIRDENSAVRIYVGQLDNQRDEDGWRQLLDARTVFADALDRQAKSRTPAFYVAPRTTDGQAVTDELQQWSPAQCAGSIRRLAAPEL
jgi:hypothetical protein